MTSRFRGRRSRSRKMLWAPFGTGEQALAASAGVGVDLLSLIRAAVPSINNFTVVRIRGFCGAAPVSPAGVQLFYEMGILIVTQPAFDAGAFPDPEADDASWMWRETLIWTPMLVRETSSGVFNTAFQLLQIDGKAQRRVDQADNTMVFSIKNRQATASEFTIEGMALLNLR